MIKDAYAEATEASINTLMIVEVRVLKELLQLGYVFFKKKKNRFLERFLDIWPVFCRISLEIRGLKVMLSYSADWIRIRCGDQEVSRSVANLSLKKQISMRPKKPK